MSMRVISRTLIVAAFSATALVITSCSGPVPSAGPGPGASGTAAPTEECGPLEEMTEVHLGKNPGLQDLVVGTMIRQEIDEKYNLDLNVHEFLNPPASALAITQGAVQIGFGGTTSMAVARSQGADVVLFGALPAPPGGVFVPNDSDIEDLGDLVGKRLGSFSANNSSTFALLSVVANLSFDIPNLEAAVAGLIVAPDGAILGLLDSGELDAVHLGSTATIVTQLGGKYKQIVDLVPDYVDAMGAPPAYLTFATKESYAAEHCSELAAFSNAVRDAVGHLQTDDEAWADYVNSLKITDPDAQQALKALLDADSLVDWDQEQIESAKEMLEAFIPILGEEEFISEVPDGLFILVGDATD